MKDFPFHGGRGRGNGEGGIGFSTSIRSCGFPKRGMHCLAVVYGGGNGAVGGVGLPGQGRGNV